MRKNEYLRNVNDVMWDAWKPGSEEKPWRTVDQWAINWGCEYYYYEDDYALQWNTHACIPLSGFE